MKILVFNAGSSSLKFKLFEAEEMVPALGERVLPQGKSLLKGMVENIGTDNAHLLASSFQEQSFRTVEAANMREALDLVLKLLLDDAIGPIDSLGEVDAVGHRIAHGGDVYSSSVRIDRKAVEVIKRYSDLAPLHNPYALQVIERSKELFPNALQVAAFDTAFHQTMPRRTYVYPIPYRYYEKYGIRKFGFHGISHKYVSRRAADFLGEDLRSLKMITCHLGAGASICAIDHGYSMDTSMGYTPLDGLMMGTRSGSLDPAIVTYVMRRERLTYDEMDRILNKKSGILGISGTSADMRDVTEAAHAGDERAQLAIDMYVHAVQKAIGSYYALMTHTDAVVLTAGIGENSAELRELIFAGLAHMGMILDKERNDFTGAIGEDRIVSIDDSPIKIFVVTADEEMRIARDTAALVNGEEVR